MRKYKKNLVFDLIYKFNFIIYFEILRLYVYMHPDIFTLKLYIFDEQFKLQYVNVHNIHSIFEILLTYLKMKFNLIIVID